MEATTMPRPDSAFTRHSIEAVHPRAVSTGGRWLALSERPSALHIGVFGNTEAEAIDNFHRSLARWAELAEEASEADHDRSAEPGGSG